MAVITNGANASYLSSSQYGYDAVLSVTQAALNDNMRDFVLKKPHKPQKLYWYTDPKLTLTPVSLARVQADAGIDPLDYTTKTPDPAIRQTLWNKGFRFATVSTLGANPSTQLNSVPNEMITFTSDGMNVILTPIWSDFTLINLTADMSWRVFSQNPNAPWSISSITRVPTATHDMKISPDPPPINSQMRVAVQQPQQSSGSSGPLRYPSQSEAAVFRVSNLLVDFSTATFWNISLQNAVTSEVNDKAPLLAPAILNAAFADADVPMQSIYTRSTPWSLPLNAYSLMVNAYVDNGGKPFTSPSAGQKNAATLNYLCSTANKKISNTSPFGWNWIQADQINPYHGIFAINRVALRDYIELQITQQVKQSCVLIVPSTSGSGSTPSFGLAFTPGQTPQQITKAEDSAQVLYFNYWSTRQSKNAGAEFNVANDYLCMVNFQGSDITFTQVARCNVLVKAGGRTALNENLMNVVYRDVYTLTVNQWGGLSWSITRTKTDSTPTNLLTPGILQSYGLPDVLGVLSGGMSGFKPMQWGSYAEGSPAPSFLLPPGSTFSCANARFSDHQDLLVNLIYAS